MRQHYDIYAIVYTPQEVHFGHEKQINLNVVETVKVAHTGRDDYDLKLYFSPTKRRGVERRSILWMPIGDDYFYEVVGCHIPQTCCSCILCDVFGGLDNRIQNISITSRVTQGGGVAVQPLPAEIKQRLVVSADLKRSIARAAEGEGDDTSATPFKKEYAEPGIWFPITTHCTSLTEEEFGLVAYAFVDAMRRYSAGHPKGGWVVTESINGAKRPLIVVDEYRAPQMNRPVVMPTTDDTSQALEQFSNGIPINQDWGDNNGIVLVGNRQDPLFTRRYGEVALGYLTEKLSAFVQGARANVEARLQSEMVQALNKLRDELKIRREAQSNGTTTG
jgi:hypothetical protein